MDLALNLSDEQFERLMAEIDVRMVSENVTLSARQIRGWMLFCENQKLQGIGFTHPISTRVMDWFRDRYGKRINWNADVGHCVEVVSGDLLRIRCCLFYGRLHVICHPALMGRAMSGPAVNQPAVVNLVDLAEGMTVAFARALTAEERKSLLRVYATSQVSLSRIGDAGMQKFVPEGQADLAESTEHMVRGQGQFGMSKWSSLQGVEKFLKAYIFEHGIVPKRIHLLGDLARAAESLGLRPLKPQGSRQKRPTGVRSKPANGVGPERGFFGDHRRISRQDRLGATISNPVDPQHLLFCLSCSTFIPVSPDPASLFLSSSSWVRI